MKQRSRGQIDVLAPELERTREALDALTFDDVLVRRADEITQLNEQRIEVRSGRNDLPKRRDEYNQELEELAKLAAEIGWDDDGPGKTD